MKKLALAALVVMAPTIAFADDVYGTWKTIPDDNGNYGHINVAACGSKICGTLVKSFDGAGKTIKTDNTGKKIIWDMVATGGGKYSGGKVWAPDRNKTYRSKMSLSGNVLAIQGCIGPICRDGGKWTRVN